MDELEFIELDDDDDDDDAEVFGFFCLGAVTFFCFGEAAFFFFGEATVLAVLSDDDDDDDESESQSGDSGGSAAAMSKSNTVALGVKALLLLLNKSFDVEVSDGTASAFRVPPKYDDDGEGGLMFNNGDGA